MANGLLGAKTTPPGSHAHAKPWAWLAGADNVPSFTKPRMDMNWLAMQNAIQNPLAKYRSEFSEPLGRSTALAFVLL